MPTFAANISALKNELLKPSSSVQTLVNVILRDPALTTKLLKTANSPTVSGASSSRIQTVSHAVALMGFDETRRSALALGDVAEMHASAPARAAAFESATTESLLSGIVAKDLAPLIDLDPEEAFLCAFLHRLGEHLTAMCLPEEHRKVFELVTSTAISPSEAAEKTLGVSFAALGQGVAAHWKLPAQLRASMEPLPKGIVEKPVSKAERLRHLSCFANELVHDSRTATSSARADVLARLGARYRRSMTLGERQLRRLFYRVIIQLSDDACKLKVDLASATLLKQGGTTDSTALHPEALGLELRSRIARERATRRLSELGESTWLQEVAAQSLGGTQKVPSHDECQKLELHCRDLVEQAALGGAVQCTVALVHDVEHFTVPAWLLQPWVSELGIVVTKVLDDNSRPIALVLCVGVAERASGIYPKLG